MTEEKRHKFLSIHTQLHTGVERFWIDNICYQIQVSSSQQPYVKFENKVFIKQNPNSSTVLGRLAKSGHQVTLISRTGKKWGSIVDNDILDPEDGE